MNYNDIIDKFCENPQILKELEPFTKSKDKLGFINKLIELINCDFDSARLVCDYLIDGTLLPSDLPPQERSFRGIYRHPARFPGEHPVKGRSGSSECSFWR